MQFKKKHDQSQENKKFHVQGAKLWNSAFAFLTFRWSSKFQSYPHRFNLFLKPGGSPRRFGCCHLKWCGSPSLASSAHHLSSINGSQAEMREEETFIEFADEPFQVKKNQILIAMPMLCWYYAWSCWLFRLGGNLTPFSWVYGLRPSWCDSKLDGQAASLGVVPTALAGCWILPPCDWLWPSSRFTLGFIGQRSLTWSCQEGGRYWQFPITTLVDLC